MRSTFYAAMLFTLSLGSSITGLAASGVRDEFKVTEVFLKADDGRPTGPCPVRVTFRGYITANGPGAIKYTFTRSDGATGPVYIMEFKKAGTQAVMTDWTLGDSRVLPRYAGWQAVKVLSPVEIESNHDTGSFEINCKGATGVTQLGGLGGRTLATDPVTIKPGQTARLEVANTSDQSLIVWLFFLDASDEVLIKKEVKIKPGGTEAIDLTGPNNPLHTGIPFVGQVIRAAVQEDAKIGMVLPNSSLRITENGQTIRLIGSEEFKEGKLRIGGTPGGPTGHPPLKTALPGQEPSFVHGAAFVTPEAYLIERGQRAQLEVKNIGSDSVTVGLQFIDNRGKVLVQRSATISPGDMELFEFPFVGGPGPNREGDSSKYPADWSGGCRAQLVTAKAEVFASLQPVLRILDNNSGETIRIIGQEGFKPSNLGNDHPNPGNSVQSEVSRGPFTVEAYLDREQVAQLEVKNIGNQATAVQLQFVDEAGKVIVQTNATIRPGGRELLEFPKRWRPAFNREGESSTVFPNSVGSFRAQFTTALSTDSWPCSTPGTRCLDVQPSLRILDNKSGDTIRLIGPEEFKELRPGNDPKPVPDGDKSIPVRDGEITRGQMSANRFVNRHVR